ncbi:hypothetical protein [Nonomuraea salmonea]|uniref:hypothetical protein n=1 Tax=Nonomuraea salmonea TaxID=46181 RepID=UPI0031EFD11D
MTRSSVTARERGGLPPQRRALTREQAQGLIGAARALPETAPSRAGAVTSVRSCATR